MQLTEAIERYILHMRASGYGYVTQAGRLHALCSFTGPIDLAALSVSDVTRFLCLRTNSNSTHRAKQALISNFLIFWQLRGQIAGMVLPPMRSSEASGHSPYVYSRDEVRRLIEGASNASILASFGIAPETTRVLFAFLYATGARLGEAIALARRDIDLESDMVSLIGTKVTGPRTVPVGPHLSMLLRAYARRDDISCSPRFFQRRDGLPLVSTTVFSWFERILARTGLTRRDGLAQRPRICDLRTTFAVHRITAWLDDDRDLQRLLPGLSAYMGYKDLSTAEGFLALVPESYRKDLNRLSLNPDLELADSDLPYGKR